MIFVTRAWALTTLMRLGNHFAFDCIYSVTVVLFELLSSSLKFVEADSNDLVFATREMQI